MQHLSPQILKETVPEERKLIQKLTSTEWKKNIREKNVSKKDTFLFFYSLLVWKDIYLQSYNISNVLDDCSTWVNTMNDNKLTREQGSNGVLMWSVLLVRQNNMIQSGIRLAKVANK